MPPATVILVEGTSDRVALEVIAARLGIDLHDTEIVAMGGATNVARFAAARSTERVIGLCDIGEERFFRRALGDAYSVCDRDLEDELIRALGVAGVEEVVEKEGHLATLRTFQNQPAQRSRTPEQQLRRFMGTMSGRKERYARALCEAVPLDRVPHPLLDVLS